MMEPKIRFKGFEGEWKTSTIGEIAPLQRGYDLPTNNVISGTIPVVYSNGILRFHNEGKCQAPAIITGRSGTIGKFTYIDHGEYWPHNTSLWVTTFHKNYPRFVYYFFQNVGFEKYATGSGVPTLNRNDIHKHIESIPSNKEEQQAIASYFTTLDSQISASTSRLASLKQMKAASLQAMFPQEGETVPKIRFKGFEGEWKKVKLSEILTERHENSTITDSLPQLSFTIADGVIRPEDRKSNKRDFLIKDIDNKRYLVTKVGDIIYNPANVVYGAIHRNSLMNGVVSPIYKIFTTMQDSNFIECAVRRPSFITKLAMCTEGTVTKLKTLKPEAFLNMEVCITPSLEEQKLIGNYFTSLDHQISFKSQRLEKLKQIKSACLDKMFV